jgi:Zn ribbon nucleic-acid-binding protein
MNGWKCPKCGHIDSVYRMCVRCGLRMDDYNIDSHLESRLNVEKA